MANKNKNYNNEDATKTLEYFQEISGVDPFILSKKNEDVYFRALLYKVLMEFNCMNSFLKTKELKEQGLQYILQ